MVKKAAVLKAPGTNNDYETLHALENSGASAEIVHINMLADGSKNLKDYAIVVIPGGFSYGDDLGAGKVFSLFLEHKVNDKLADIIKDGRIVLGICNGFQVLVRSGLLPDVQSVQSASLAANLSGKFICKWIRVSADTGKFWFKGLPEEFELPIAHAEGRFVMPEEKARLLDKKGQIVLKYTDNPNGSVLNIAGIQNPAGNVLGLMPHPERFFSSFQHPASGIKEIEPYGKRIFKNIIENA